MPPLAMMKENNKVETRLVKKIENVRKPIDNAEKIVSIIVYIVFLTRICKIILDVMWVRCLMYCINEKQLKKEEKKNHTTI